MTSPAPDHDEHPVFDRLETVPPQGANPFGTGTYRRRIIVRRAGEVTVGELEDDFHHFAVELHCPGGTVSRVIGDGRRAPWSTCFDTDQPLQAVVGTTLATGPLALSHLDARSNCTHLFDLTGLAVTHAARGVDGDRRYDMEVGDPSGDNGERHARLWRDGELVLDWHLHDRTLVDPADWIEAPLWKGFIPWAAEHLADDIAEAAVALRRALDISRGRMGDLDMFETADALLPGAEGVCHSFQAHIAPVALRQRGTGRDFTDDPAQLLADFDARNP